MQSAYAVIDRSGTVTTGGTAQQAAAANSGRRFLLLGNSNATVDLWFRFAGTAAINGAGSFNVAPKTTLVFADTLPSDTLSVISGTTAHAFTVLEI